MKREWHFRGVWTRTPWNLYATDFTTTTTKLSVTLLLRLLFDLHGKVSIPWSIHYDLKADGHAIFFCLEHLTTSTTTSTITTTTLHITTTTTTATNTTRS